MNIFLWFSHSLGLCDDITAPCNMEGEPIQEQRQEELTPQGWTVDVANGRTGVLLY